jgi:hypothetical protein
MMKALHSSGGAGFQPHAGASNAASRRTGGGSRAVFLREFSGHSSPCATKNTSVNNLLARDHASFLLIRSWAHVPKTGGPGTGIDVKNTAPEDIARSHDSQDMRSGTAGKPGLLAQMDRRFHGVKQSYGKREKSARKN